METLDDAIKIPSIREQVVRRIRAAIVYGEIEAGPIHSAPALAERMGVSITPVREALLELTHRGLVSQVRNRGFRVVERGLEDLDDTLEIRTLVELPMMAKLAGGLDPESVNRFRGIVEAGIEAARQADLSAFLDLDRRFHLGLLRRAGNPLIVEVIDQALDRMRLASFASDDASLDLASVADGHGEILDALVAADTAAVERAMRDHFEFTRMAWRAANESPPTVAA